jgi:chitin disaccharide deacetylase
MTTAKLTTMLLCVLNGVLLAVCNATAAEPTYAERLGWPAGSKVVIFHVDDAAMSHDSDMGAIEAIEKGVATSTSIMFPCPWVSEMAHYIKQHPDFDAGLHTTLTSEWHNYRWGPVAGKKQVPSMVDKEGCLWPELSGRKLPKANEVDIELRAQLDRCRTMGIVPTHLDSHMGGVFESPAFMLKYMQLGIENHIPVMLPGGHMHYIAKGQPMMVVPARVAGKQLWDAGLPVLDDLHTGGGAKSPSEKKAQIIEFLRTLKPGLTQFIVHCTRPSDIFKDISGSGPMRLAELEAMCDPDVKKVVEEEKIILTTWRELKQRRDKVK